MNDFTLGDKIVHPLHGAGIIEDIAQQKVNGEVRSYYVMRVMAGGMTVMIPVQSAVNVGLRPVMCPEEADCVIASIADIIVEDDRNWNKRYRDNMIRIKSGELREVAKVIKSLIARDRERGLSAGERKMLHSAKQILVSELVLSKSVTYEQAEKQLSDAMEEKAVV